MEEKSVLNAEIPETLRRMVKSHAALKGQTVSEFVTAALQRAVTELDQTEAAKDGGAR
ncbi:MAG TPA: hypothetical protein VGC79_25330 [Polyangiaceae bacterium]